MANVDQLNFKFLALDGSGSRSLGSCPEAAGTQTFKTGDLVYKVAGLLTGCATDGVLSCGVAAQDATGTSGTILRYWRHPLARYEVNTYEVSSPGTKFLAALAGDGNDYELVVSGNKAYIDLDAHINGFWKIHELVDAVGTGYGKVIASVILKADQDGNYTA